MPALCCDVFLCCGVAFEISYLEQNRVQFNWKERGMEEAEIFLRNYWEHPTTWRTDFESSLPPDKPDYFNNYEKIYKLRGTVLFVCSRGSILSAYLISQVLISPTSPLSVHTDFFFPLCVQTHLFSSPVLQRRRIDRRRRRRRSFGFDAETLEAI